MLPDIAHSQQISAIPARKSRHQLRMGVHAEMAVYITHITVNGVDTQTEIIGDLFPRPPLHEEAEDLAGTGRQ